MTPTLPVEQADRDAAADYIDRQHGSTMFTAEQGFRSGEADDHQLIQAFARHRITALSGLDAARRILHDMAARRHGCSGMNVNEVDDWFNEHARSVLASLGDRT